MSKEDDFSKSKNLQAWNALRQFAQPAIIATSIGMLLKELSHSEFCRDHRLLEPAISFPLAGIALASLINVSEPDATVAVKNYLFFGLKGLLVSIAIILSGPSSFLFEKLNEGWMKDVFSGNLLHLVHGTGLRTMVLFHSMDKFMNEKIVKFVYGK